MEGSPKIVRPRSRSKKRHNDNNDDALDFQPSASVPAISLESPREYFMAIADFTAADLSIFFLIFFAAATYFHEQYYMETVTVIGLWIIVQTISSVLSVDIRNDLFWSVIGTLGQIAFYLLLGFIWSYFKL